MNYFKMLGKSGKIRLSIFIVLMGFLVCLAVGYAAELSQAVRYVKAIGKAYSAVEQITIDGADFSWFFLPVGEIAVNLVVGIAAVAYEFVMVIASLLCLGIFRLAAFRKTTEIQPEEYILGRQMQKVLCIGSTAVSFLMTVFASPAFGLMGIVLNLPVLLFSWLFYILSMKNRIEDHEQDNADVSSFPS